MASITSEPVVTAGDVKPMRADARRNYDKLMAAAREVFAERGSEGSLDEIARRAGVGPGTLYRHFPTRDDLIGALMRDWTARVTADSEAAVAAGLPARETLQRWFSDLVRHLTLHRGVAARLSAAMDDPMSPIYRMCQLLVQANDHVVSHLADEHALRRGVEARQVIRLVSGIATVADASSISDAEVRSMLDIVIGGIVAEPTTT